MHYWLLAGQHGTAIRHLGWPDGNVRRIARTVAVLRAEYSRPLPVERLAPLPGMRPSAFQHPFRTVTPLSTPQFHHHPLTIAPRRLSLPEGVRACVPHLGRCSA